MSEQEKKIDQHSDNQTDNAAQVSEASSKTSPSEDAQSDTGFTQGTKDNLKEFADKAGKEARENAEAIEAQWSGQVSSDAQELKNILLSDVHKVEHVAEDVRHPSRIVEAGKREAKKIEKDAEKDLYAAKHPSVIAEDIKKRVDNVKQEITDTSEAIVSEFKSSEDSKKLAPFFKVFGVLLIVAFSCLVPLILRDSYFFILDFSEGKYQLDGMSTVVVMILYLIVRLTLAITYITFGIRLLRNQRRWAAILSYLLYILIPAAALCSIMLYGLTEFLWYYVVCFAVIVILQTHLDPTLHEERVAYRKRRLAEDYASGKAGTLGRDQSGKGYIALNFFNLFWIFVIASIVGLYLEEIFHYLVVAPGQWQDRAGLLFGPFSPIYGCGAVLMTLFLNRFHKSNVIIIFFVAAVIGGAFEYCTSLFMQYAYGAVAWNYTGMWLSIGGRTCGLFMAIWGLLGVIWIKVLLPLVLHVVNLIPWQWRYTITTVAAAFMLVDAVMSLQALDSWYMRLSGDPVVTPIQQFYADHFDNTVMADRFQSMTIDPGSSIRH